jgi:hypothetical protein
MHYDGRLKRREADTHRNLLTNPTATGVVSPPKLADFP